MQIGIGKLEESPLKPLRNTMDFLKPSAKIEKAVVNVGVGKLRKQAGFEEKILPEIIKELSMITGQKPIVRPVKKSIAGFGVREGDLVGLKITLRRNRLDDFVNRLRDIVWPRVRDFKGISLDAIDNCGSLNFGFRDQLVFPEIDPSGSKVNFGLQVTLTSKIRNKPAMIDFYRAIGLPLKKN